MNTEEIIDMARQAGARPSSNPDEYDVLKITIYDLETFVKLVDAKATARERERYMQLFLDPENQPTQFGTATQEYREKEIKEVQDLLTELAHHVRTQHLYGPEVKAMLEQEAAIRNRGDL